MANLKAMSLMALAGLFFCTASVRAQDCPSLIALSKTVSVRTEDKRAIDDNAAAFCSDYKKFKSSSSGSNFGASYKFLAASMGKSNASVDVVASTYCSSSSDYSARSDAYSEYIETIAPGAYPAYEACVRASNNPSKLIFGLDLGSVLPTEFTLNVSHNSNVQGSTAVLTYVASNDVNCAWQDEAGPKITIPSGTTTVLKCQRSDPARASYAKVVRTNISTRETNESSITIPWQAYDKNGLPLNVLQALKDEVSQLRQSVAAKGVGEIVASMLSVKQFQETYNRNGEQWELAQGQDTPAGTRYRTEVGEKLPDLRGVFLRGKNHGRDATIGNPEGDLNLGDHQKDAVVAHTHGLTQLDIGGGETDPRSDNVRAKHRNNVQESTDSFGGLETRPRNVTVNFFVRVN